MIQQTWLLISLFLFFVLILEWIGKLSWGRKIFSVVPKIFWLYFLPMVLSNVGLVPFRHEFYDIAKDWGLLLALFFLLLGSRPSQMIRLGLPTLVLMLAGSLAIVLGALLLFPLFQSILPENAWQMIGPLAGSWIGGSLNMVAVARAFDISAQSYAPIILVDTLVGYSWMALLLLGAGKQKQLDRFFTKPAKLPKWRNALAADWNSITSQNDTDESKPVTFATLAALLFFGILFSGIAFAIGDFLAGYAAWLPGFAWTIMAITFAGMAWGQVMRRFYADYNNVSDRLGSLFLSVLISVIGAQGKISFLGESWPLFIFGILWILIHGLVLFAFGWFFRYPIKMIAAASQCNIGGVVSGPIVAEAYSKGLAPLALLMAVAGNIYGFYFALFVSRILQIWSGS